MSIAKDLRLIRQYIADSAERVEAYINLLKALADDTEECRVPGAREEINTSLWLYYEDRSIINIKIDSVVGVWSIDAYEPAEENYESKTANRSARESQA